MPDYNVAGMDLPAYLRRLRFLSPEISTEIAQTAPIQQAPIAPISVPQIQQAQIAPAPVINQLPYHQQYANAAPPLNPYPERVDYKPSLTRKIAGVAAGFLGGLGGHPEFGAQIVNQPYDRALADWQNRVNVISPLIKSEDEQAKLGNAVNIAQGRLEGARNVSQGNLQGRIDLGNLKLGEFQQGEQRRNMADSEKARHNREVEATAAKKASQEKEDPLTRRLKAFDDNVKAYMLANPGVSLDEAEKQVGIKIANAYTGNAPAAVAKEQALMAPRVETAGKVAEASTTGKLKGESSDEALIARHKIDMQKAMDKWDAEQEFKNQLSGELIQNLQNTPPEKQQDFIKNLSPKTREALLSLPQQQLDLSKMVTNPQAKVSIQNAQTSIGHINNVMGYLKDPEIQANVGPLVGRLSLLKSKTGKPQDDYWNVDLTSLSQKEQAYLTSLQQLLNWEVKNVSGNRPAAQVFDRLKATSANPYMNVQQQKGALEGIYKSVNVVINSALGKTDQSNIPADFKGSSSPQPKKKFSEMLQEVK